MTHSSTKAAHTSQLTSDWCALTQAPIARALRRTGPAIPGEEEVGWIFIAAPACSQNSTPAIPGRHRTRIAGEAFGLCLGSGENRLDSIKMGITQLHATRTHAVDQE